MTRTDTEPFRDNTGDAFRGFRFSDLYWYLVLLAIAFVLALLQPVVWAQQPAPQGDALDPPASVARLNLAEGAVSFAPGDAADAWTPAALNRPLTAGDRLWTGPQARAELHAGSTAVRMNSQTSLDLLALDDNTTQLRQAQLGGVVVQREQVQAGLVVHAHGGGAGMQFGARLRARPQPVAGGQRAV